jgi:general secretion pathway protein K
MGLGAPQLECESIMRSRQRFDQQGAVLLLALLAVALITAMISTALWHQSALIRIESTERERQQGQWLLHGALDWARLILREDARTSSADHLSEPWAVPLQEGRLSNFLSAQPGLSTETTATAWADQVFLSGGMEDAQGKFNLSNVLRGADLDPTGMAQWSRLWTLLGWPASGAETLAKQLQQAQNSTGTRFTPRTLDDLKAWGWDDAVLTRLRAHVVILPERTTLNVNTASAEVLAACIQGMDLSRAQQLAQLRLRAPWSDLAQAQQAIGSAFDPQWHGVSSRYFLLWGRLRMGSTPLVVSALVRRDTGLVSYVWMQPLAPEGQP